jgi:vacuolar-type H+-ATPase subunit C/Vma6
VTVQWEDVNARARGLATRLLSPEAIAGLARARDLRELSRALAGLEVLPEEIPDASAPALELALRRAAARELRLVWRWLGPRADVVSVALEAEDRRSLRALVRGAAAGVHAEGRLTGLLPTPTLPERLLRELAGRSSVRDQATLLVAAGHPAGPLLLAAAAPQEPDLFAVESAIAQSFAERALRGARRGGQFLLEYVGDLLDAENARTALLLARAGVGDPPASAFIAGGRRLSQAHFERAASSGDSVRAAGILGEALGGGVEAGLLLRHADAPAALEAALEELETDRLIRAARLDPLGPAPLLLYLRRLRAQSVALGELVWSLDLGIARRSGDLAVAGVGAA